MPGEPVAPEALPQTEPQTAPEPQTRPETGSGPPTGPDTGPDTGPHTGPDTGPHTGPDTGPQTRAGWPAFARRYPNDAELARLVAAFARGNFALVRREAVPLAERAESREVAAAARELRGRIEPSHLASYLLALGVALMLFLYFFYARLRG